MGEERINVWDSIGTTFKTDVIYDPRAARVTRVTSLNPLFLMLSFLALTKSKSLPYSSLEKARKMVRKMSSGPMANNCNGKGS